MNEQTQSTPAETLAAPRRRYLCRHIFTDGHRCGSPSLRGKELCYYHTRARHEGPCASRGGTFLLPRIDDRPAVQIALYDVLSRIAAGDIDFKRGSILLYGLQIASSNLPRHSPIADEQAQPLVEEITTDYRLGDLAPVAELPTPAEVTSPADAQTPAETADPAESPLPAQNSMLHQSEEKRETPGIPTAPPPTPDLTDPPIPTQPVSLSQREESPEPFRTPSPYSQLPPPPRYTGITHDSYPRMAP